MAKNRITCSDCGFKIRGDNHKEGSHHASRRPSKRQEQKGKTNVPPSDSVKKGKK